jgi:hypothetical protein
MRNKASPRKVLSENLRALMSVRPDLGTIKKVAEASGSALSNGKVGRIYAASHTTDIDTLQDLASVFKLEPWQLLVEGLNPNALPRLADASVLNQILDAVRSSAATVHENVSMTTPTHPSENGHPLEKATTLASVVSRTKGKKKRESRKSGPAQKPRTGRGA